MTLSHTRLRVLSVFALAFLTSMTAAPLAHAQAADPHDPAYVQARVRQYFADIPTMPEVARCESGFRQYGPDGLVLFDPSYTMIGVFQISSAHMPEALALGLDITTLEGNLVYARHLFNLSGIDPWMSSFGCWGNAVKTTGTVLGTTTAPTPSVPITAAPSTLALNLGVSSQSVLIVQQMLNKIGFTVAASGPGSAGNETSMYGSLTRAAVRKFQCAKGIACSGDESTTGYGMVDDKTYQALEAAVSGNTAPATPAPTSTADSAKAAQIANIQAQISSLNSQIGTLQAQLSELMK